MLTVLAIIGVLVALGLFFGFVLAIANKKLAVELNPLVHVVEDILPKGQCGACGFAGCQAYAEAVVTDPSVSPSLCAPGKEAVAKQVAELTGKKADEIIPQEAYVKCACPSGGTTPKYQYTGVKDCLAASLLHAGPKACDYGCLGFGSCVKACVFHAIRLNDENLPVVDAEKCTGCGKCAEACPKHVIEMLPLGYHVEVVCSSHDKGAEARKNCKAACIGCGLCVRSCPHGAVKVENNLAVVDHEICMAQCAESTCLAKCPTGAIRAAVDVKEPVAQPV